MLKVQVYENGIEYIDDRCKHGLATVKGELLGEFEDDEAMNIIWWYEFNNDRYLSDMQRDLIRLVASKYIEMDKSKALTSNGIWIKPELLYKMCLIELMKNKALKVCDRCGGTGKHSINGFGETYCYKCNGLGAIVPKKLTKVLIKEITRKEIYL